jgi:hypothetical protein
MPTVNRWLVEESNAVSVYPNAEVPQWGRVLVGTSTIRYVSTDDTFLTEFGPEFNLTHTYLNDSEVAFQFLTHRPTSVDYVVTFNTDNELKNSNANLVHSQNQTVDGFIMFVRGATMSNGGVYTVHVYHNDMVLIDHGVVVDQI